MAEEKICLICGAQSSEEPELLFIKGKMGCICSNCLRDCTEAVENYYSSEQNMEEFLSEEVVTEEAKKYKTPEEIVSFLDQYVVGQDRAKRKLANAVYNHYKMLDYNEQKSDDDVEIRKSNVLLLGPTGSGRLYV